MPILIGGSGPKVTLKLVARHAKYWHSFGDVDAFHAQERRPARALRERAAATPPTSRSPGARARISTRAAADALIDAGVHHLIADVGGDGSGYDLGHVRELVQWRDAR